MNNITLTAMPWAGKTSIWKRLASELKYNFVDFDDDVLEKINNETAEEVIWILNLRPNWIKPEDISNTLVSDLVKLLWDDNFIKLEGFMWKQLFFLEPTILSASGSLPLNIDTMRYLRQDWKVIYIKEDVEKIIHRLELMKDDRIIWMSDWKTLKEVLDDRRSFYRATRDLKFVVRDQGFIDINNEDEVKASKEVVYNDFIAFIEKNWLYIPDNQIQKVW